MTGETAEEITRRTLERFRGLNTRYLVERLKARGYEAVAVDDEKDALREILARVPAGSSVGAGGSLSLGRLSALEALRERGHEVFYPVGTVTAEESLRLRHAGLAADVFLSGVNALTREGEIVNLDGLGNRVAATCFGPRRVIFVCGVNKICEDLEAAVARTREIAAPANAMRLGLETPCADSGFCHDCDSPQRICNRLVIHLRAGRQETHLILVARELGL